MDDVITTTEENHIMKYLLVTEALYVITAETDDQAVSKAEAFAIDYKDAEFLTKMLPYTGLPEDVPIKSWELLTEQDKKDITS